MRNKSTCLLAFIFLVMVFVGACSKPENTPADPCASKTIVLNAVATATSGGTTSNGSITATASGSTGFTYSLNNGPFQTNGNFSNLAAATYSVIAKDTDGCTATKSFVVSAAACPTITLTATSVNASSQVAADGRLTATATGSTGFSYSINNGIFQANAVFNNLAANSYNITVKDLNGCTVSASFVVSSASCPAINVVTTVTQSSGPTATNGAINGTATGGVAPYTYSKDGTTFQASSAFTNLVAGTYTILVKDANGCIGSSGAVVVPSAACPALSIVTTITGSDKCSNNTGSISIAASGSTGFMYNINNGNYQLSNLFASLAAGAYPIAVRDVNGCVQVGAATVNVAAAGPNFASVKAILTANCAISGCHAGASPQNGINFTDDCTIVAQSSRIKVRAVDAIPSIMPPSGSISAADKQKIVDWINAGGKHSN